MSGAGSGADVDVVDVVGDAEVGGDGAGVVSFDDLVTAATVGVSRRPLRIGALAEPAAGHAGALDSGDPAAALLDAAGLLDAGRRAGVWPTRGIACLTPAADDGSRELSARAGRLLGQVASSDTETLADLLTAAGSAGYRAAAPLLPTLLDAATRAKALRPAVAAVLGARGRWLAAQRPEWRAMTAVAAPAGQSPSVPDAAFSRRAAVRAAAVLRLEENGRRGRLERDGGRGRLVASVPESLDDAMARDGIAGRPLAAGVDTGVWLLIQVIAAAPLGCWETMFGLGAGQIVALPVGDGLGAAVHAGWRLAAIRQRDVSWARALLYAGAPAGVSFRPGPAWPEDYELAAVLPADERAARAADLLGVAAAWLGRPAAGQRAGDDAAAAIREVSGCPGPWPDVLAEAFVAMLRRTVRPAPRPGWPRELMLIAARHMPVTGPADYAAQLTQLADTPDCPAPWAAVLRRTAATIALRRAFYEEIR